MLQCVSHFFCRFLVISVFPQIIHSSPFTPKLCLNPFLSGYLQTGTLSNSETLMKWRTGPRSAVGNASGNRCESDCRSRGSEFDPSPVPYFRAYWSWNNLYGHSRPFCWLNQEGLLSVTSESMCTKYWLTALLVQACPGKGVVRWTDCPAMTISVDSGRQATKQTNNLNEQTNEKTHILAFHQGLHCLQGYKRNLYLWQIRNEQFHTYSINILGISIRMTGL